MAIAGSCNHMPTKERRRPRQRPQANHRFGAHTRIGPTTVLATAVRSLYYGCMTATTSHQKPDQPTEGRYTLTADLDGHPTATEWFRPASSAIRVFGNADNAAVADGSFLVMRLAEDSTLWSKGRITLTSPTGEVLNVMEAKA